MTREPNSLPEGIISWGEWRQVYAEYLTEYLYDLIDRATLRDRFKSLNVQDIEAALNEALEKKTGKRQ
jgi:hypothetical protein